MRQVFNPTMILQESKTALSSSTKVVKASNEDGLEKSSGDVRVNGKDKEDTHRSRSRSIKRNDRKRSRSRSKSGGGSRTNRHRETDKDRREHYYHSRDSKRRRSKSRSRDYQRGHNAESRVNGGSRGDLKSKDDSRAAESSESEELDITMESEDEEEIIERRRRERKCLVEFLSEVTDTTEPAPVGSLEIDSGRKASKKQKKRNKRDSSDSSRSSSSSSASPSINSDEVSVCRILYILKLLIRKIATPLSRIFCSAIEIKATIYCKANRYRNSLNHI